MAGETPPLTYRDQNPDENDRLERIAQEEHSSFLDYASKVTLLGIGASIFSRKVLQKDLFSYAAHYLGKFYDSSYLAASSAGRIAKGNPYKGIPQAARSYLDRSGKAGPAPGRDLDIHRYISESLDLLTAPDIQSNIAARTRLAQEAFEKEYSRAIPHYYDESLRRLTVGQVLDDQKRFAQHFGANQWNAIKGAHQKKLLKRDYILDKDIYIDSASKKIVDARLKNPRALASLAFKNFNPLNIFSPTLDLLDKPGFLRVPGYTQISKGTKLGPGEHIYAFGKLFKPVAADTVQQIDVPFKLKTVRAGSKIYEGISAAAGNLRTREAQGRFAGLQNFLGIGPSFRDRDQLFYSLLAKPYRAAAAVNKGKATPKLFEFISSSKSTSPFLEYFAAEHGVVTEAGKRASQFAVRSPFTSLDDLRFFKGKSGRKFTEKLLDEIEFQKIRFGQKSRYGALFDPKDVTASDIAQPRISKNLYKENIQFAHPWGPVASTDMPLSSSMYGNRPSDIAERAKALLRSTPEKDVARVMSSGGQGLNKQDQFLYDSLRRVRANAAGSLTVSNYPTHGVFSSGTVARGVGNFLALRLNTLAGYALGIGIRPSQSVFKNWARVAALPVLGTAAFETAKYADYQLNRTLGFSPVNTAATAYTKLRVGQQQLREETGLRSFFESTERVMPGLMESGFGFLMRHGLLFGGSLALTLKANPMAGLVAGFAGYGAIGGTSLSQSAEELRQEYSGERLVPIMKNRGWGFGRGPLEGGRIDYYTASWYQKLLKKPDTKAIYGSQEEYFSKYANIFGIPFPTPENIFGIRNILDPYALESRHFYDRPYPKTAALDQEFPIVGPILGATLGEFFKPQLRMHTAEMQGPKGVHTNIYNSHLPRNAAQALGLPQYPGSSLPVAEAGSYRDTLVAATHKMTEPLGFYKFLAERWLNILPENTYQEATASTIDSRARAFYALQIGGGAGLTEGLRRFFLPEEGDPNKLARRVNPIRNSAPDWLPGIGSQFPRDQMPWVDFSTGDMYSKILGGETRLPGEGYEQLFGLHSGVKGVYDPVDRFMILSNVSPYSAAHSKYKAIATSMLRKGQIRPEFRTRVEQMIGDEDYKKRKYKFYDRRYTKEPSTRTGFLSYKQDIAEGNILAATTGFERTLGAGWEMFSHDVLANIPYVGSKLAPFYSPIEHYEKFQLYGSEMALWHQPWSDIVRPAMYETANAPFGVGALKGGVLGYMLGNGPFSMFNPFPGTRNSSLIGIGAFAGSLGSTASKIYSGGGPFIPPHIQRERTVEEYFDKIRYVKARILEERAKEMGQGSIAASYRREAGSTFTGMTSTSSLSAMRRAVSRRERSYFDQFVDAPSYQRSRILEMVSPRTASIYSRIWGEQSELSNRTQADADQEAIEYFRTHVMPPKNSPIWHPDVPMQAIKAAYLDSGINGVADSFSKFDVYPRTVEETQTRFPELYDFVPQNLNESLFHGLTAKIAEGLSPYGNDVRSLGNIFNSYNFSNIRVFNNSSSSYQYFQELMR